MVLRALLVALIATLLLNSQTVQGLRVIRSSDAVQLDAFEDENSTSAPGVLENYDNLVDLKEIIKDYNATKIERNNVNWRSGLKFTEALTYMLNASKLTDCAFVVGKDDHIEKIEAHAVILAAASPVFEAAFENATSFRVADWQAAEFKKLLRFIYSGDLCFDDFEEACTILKLASSLELAGANDAAREYITNYMFPNRLWQAFQCAKEAHDKELTDTVMKVISAHTSEAMKDQKFSEVSRDDVSTLLQRDDLAVTSEVELFEAVTRWGLKQVTNANQKPTPELIRQALGPSIIKSIRFLTMSGAEFSQIHLSSRILDYEEGLAVLLYINSPGGLEMPSTLSSSTKKRTAQLATYEGAGTFYSLAPDSGKCNNDSKKGSSSYSDLYTTTIIPLSSQLSLHGIQIPKSLEARSDCSLKEHFDVLILDSSNNVVRTVPYNQVPPCNTERYKFATKGSATSFTDKYLINVQFSPYLSIPRASSGINKYKIKIVFYEKREYPRWVDAGAATASPSTSEYSNYGQTYSSTFQRHGYFRVLHNRPFVYSLYTD